MTHEPELEGDTSPAELEENTCTQNSKERTTSTKSKPAVRRLSIASDTTLSDCNVVHTVNYSQDRTVYPKQHGRE